jgi:gliding motility-associated-like protein
LIKSTSNINADQNYGFKFSTFSPLNIASQPLTIAVCLNATASFSIAAAGTSNINYQWQKFNGSIFTDVVNGGGYSGTTSAAFNVNTTGNFGAGNYRCKVSGDFAPDVFSNTVTLTVNPGCDIVVFNGISPNGDGLNDFLTIQNIELLPETKNNTVTIYSRWGDEVFKVSDYNNKDRVFKGNTNNGSKLPAGTYFYKIVLPNADKTMTGFISIKH